MKSSAVILACVLLVTCGSPEATAQISTILRESIEAAAKGTAKAAAKGAQESVEMALPKVSSLLTRGVSEAVEGSAKAGATAARLATREAVKAAAKHGDDICLPIVATFGDDGARALSSISKDSGAKLAQMAPDLAKHPMASSWISTIGKYGDSAVSWLWDRRLSIAVGTTATAVLLQPQQFIEAGEHVATAAINAAGEHFVEPIIAESASHVVEPLIRGLAASPAAISVFTSIAIGLMILTTLLIAWLYAKRSTVAK